MNLKCNWYQWDGCCCVFFDPRQFEETHFDLKIEKLQSEIFNYLYGFALRRNLEIKYFFTSLPPKPEDVLPD
jgi:hypothetical protein